jgi:hypothetical protein
MARKPYDCEELAPGREAVDASDRSEEVYFPEFKYAVGAPSTGIGQRHDIGPGEGGRNYPGIEELFTRS